MIVTVTLNPCIDKSTSIDKLKPDVKMRCTEVVREPGGGGINVSKALKKLDTASVALFPAGGNNGNMLCSLLHEENIIYHAMDTSVETRENWIALESSTNCQYRFTFPGLPVKEETIKKLVDQIRAFSPTYVVASGSLPPGLPAYFYGLVVKTANADGARCIVDTSSTALEALKGKHAFLIKPNTNELCNLLKIEKLPRNEIADAAQQAIIDGYAEMIALSMGAEGAWLISRDERHFAPAPMVKKKSTVGAGDSMVAGITYALQKQYSLKDTIAMGVACGSAATMNEGTRLFDTEDAFRLFDWVRDAMKATPSK